MTHSRSTHEERLQRMSAHWEGFPNLQGSAEQAANTFISSYISSPALIVERTINCRLKASGLLQSLLPTTPPSLFEKSISTTTGERHSKETETVEMAMKSLGLWHDFNPETLDTYPQAERPVQVRFINDLTTEGECEDFFPECKRLTVSLIKEWRYIPDSEPLYTIPRMFGDYDNFAPVIERPTAISDPVEEPFGALSSSEQFIWLLTMTESRQKPRDQRCRKSPCASQTRTWNKHCDPNVSSG
jgi:hypothetical protein